jgi:hypothetical protein
MRMTASWCDHIWIDRIQGCGAIFAPDGGLASEFVGCKLAVSHVTPFAGAKQRCECVAARRRIVPSCSPPSRTLRAARAVARRRAILDSRCARRRLERAAGAEELVRRGRTKELERKRWLTKGKRIENRS